MDVVNKLFKVISPHIEPSYIYFEKFVIYQFSLDGSVYFRDPDFRDFPPTPHHIYAFWKRLIEAPSDRLWEKFQEISPAMLLTSRHKKWRDCAKEILSK